MAKILDLPAELHVMIFDSAFKLSSRPKYADFLAHRHHHHRILRRPFNIPAAHHPQSPDHDRDRHTVASLLVSRAYYSRALLSYYKRSTIAIPETPGDLAKFQTIPFNLKRAITFIELHVNFFDRTRILLDLVATCPRLTTLTPMIYAPFQLTGCPECSPCNVLPHLSEWRANSPRYVSNTYAHLVAFVIIKDIIKQRNRTVYWTVSANWSDVADSSSLWCAIYLNDCRLGQFGIYLIVLSGMATMEENSSAMQNPFVEHSRARLRSFVRDMERVERKWTSKKLQSAFWKTLSYFWYFGLFTSLSICVAYFWLAMHRKISP